jgi:hypothetical protein
MSDLAVYMSEDERMAQHFVESRLVQSVKNISDAMVLIVCGKSMGLTAFESVSGIHMIEGRPQISAGLMATAIKQSGKYDFTVTAYSDLAVTVEFYQIDETGRHRIGDPITWDMAKAKRAGLDGRANWKKYPAAMLRSRAISEGYKTYCPDALGRIPVYVEGELEPPRRNVTPRGQVAFDADWRDEFPVATDAELGALSLLIADVEKFQPKVQGDMEEFYMRPVLQFTSRDVAAATIQLNKKLEANKNDK